jgi:hypothetical protein
MVYIAVALHRRVSQLAVLDETGATLACHRIPSQRAEFLRVLGELEPGPIEVAFEATNGWGWFADLLADAGVAAHMGDIGRGRPLRRIRDRHGLPWRSRCSVRPVAPGRAPRRRCPHPQFWRL